MFGGFHVKKRKQKIAKLANFVTQRDSIARVRRNYYAPREPKLMVGFEKLLGCKNGRLHIYKALRALSVHSYRGDRTSSQFCRSVYLLSVSRENWIMRSL